VNAVLNDSWLFIVVLSLLLAPCCMITERAGAADR